MSAGELGRKAVIAALLAPALLAAFVLLLTGAFALPNGPIVANLLDRPDLIDDRRADNGRVIDADTECIGLSVGLYRAPGPPASAFERAMGAQSLYGCEQFLKWLETGEPTAHREYFRYWHGYAAIARPALSLIAYNDLRGHLFTISAGLLAALAWRLGRDFGAATGLAIALPFAVLNAMGFWVVATKAVSWFLAVGGALAASRRPREEPPVLVFFILGALTAFFDFLTTPALIFALPALVYFLYAVRNGEVSRPFLQLLALGAFWAAGYVGLWAAKFAVAAAVLDADVWRDVAGAAATRLRGRSEYIDTFLPGAAIYANFAALKVFWGPVAILLFMILPAATSARRSRWARLWREGRIFLAVAAIPIAWLELLSNHSQIHAAFTHLNFAPAAMIALMVLAGREDILCANAAAFQIRDRGSTAAREPR